MALVEQAYIAYSKKLLEGVQLDPFIQQKSLDKTKIRFFLPALDSLCKRYPNYVFPPYFKAKLLLAQGSGTDVLSEILPFARKKRNTFWVWTVIAEVFPKDDDKTLACYCKALSLNTPEEFLVNAREKLAEILISRQMFDEAIIEIRKASKTRESKGWRPKSKLSNWQKSPWFTNSQTKTDHNDRLYRKYSPLADRLLFGNRPVSIVVIDNVSKVHRKATYVKDEATYGSFKYLEFFKSLKPGDEIAVSFLEKTDLNPAKIIYAAFPSSGSTSPAKQKFEGKFKQIKGRDFGFVNKIFVPPSLVATHKLSGHSIIKGIAILAYDRSKKKVGWKAIEIHS